MVSLHLMQLLRMIWFSVVGRFINTAKAFHLSVYLSSLGVLPVCSLMISQWWYHIWDLLLYLWSGPRKFPVSRKELVTVGCRSSFSPPVNSNGLRSYFAPKGVVCLPTLYFLSVNRLPTHEQWAGAMFCRSDLWAEQIVVQAKTKTDSYVQADFNLSRS